MVEHMTALLTPPTARPRTAPLTKKSTVGRKLMRSCERSRGFSSRLIAAILKVAEHSSATSFIASDSCLQSDQNSTSTGWLARRTSLAKFDSLIWMVRVIPLRNPNSDAARTLVSLALREVDMSDFKADSSNRGE